MFLANDPCDLAFSIVLLESVFVASVPREKLKIRRGNKEDARWPKLAPACLGLRRQVRFAVQQLAKVEYVHRLILFHLTSLPLAGVYNAALTPDPVCISSSCSGLTSNA